MSKRSIWAADKALESQFAELEAGEAVEAELDALKKSITKTAKKVASK